MNDYNPAHDCMIFLLAKAYQKAHGMFKKELAPFGITNMQHLILEALWFAQGLTAADLGNALKLDKATLSNGLDRMVEAGWITKEKDEHDKRVVRLHTTEKADSLKDKLQQARQKTNERILEKFSVEERILIKRLLSDLL